MFDEDTKITLFVVAAAAFLMTMGLDRMAPRAPLETAVATASLPPLPLSVALDGSPAQTNVSAMRVELGGGFEAQLLYGYVIEGRVVTRREFRNDPTSDISPLDLGIVWGELAEPGRTDAFEFRALHRAVRYTPHPGADLPENWQDQVTNNHLIPAGQAVNDALMAVEVGAQVRISGYLVVVTGDRIAPWRSSVRRDDNTLLRGCEIILVTGVEVLTKEQEAA